MNSETMRKSLIRTMPSIVLIPGVAAPLMAYQTFEAHVVMGLVATVCLIMISLVISLTGQNIAHNARTGFALLLVAGSISLAVIVCSPLFPTQRLSLETLAPLLCITALCALHTEAYAVKNGFMAALLDALALGLSFSLLLLVTGVIRDTLGNTFFTNTSPVSGYLPAPFFMSVPGIFLLVAGAGAAGMILSLRKKRGVP